MAVSSDNIATPVQSRYMSDSILQGGIRFTKLDGATPAVFNPVVGVVLTVPSMWDRWPNLQEMLRSVMETHAQSITGIDFSYELGTEDVIVGHDGQNLKVPTRTSRSEVTPSATFKEYPGMPIYNLFRTWMFDIQHPDTNMSLLPAQVDNSDNGHAGIPGWYMSAYSMSMLFIQYDPRHALARYQVNKIEHGYFAAIDFCRIKLHKPYIWEEQFARGIGR